MAAGAEYLRLSSEGIFSNPPIPAEASPTQSAGGPYSDEVVFHWNLRNCTGKRIHRAILDENYTSVARMLSEDPSLIKEKFHYRTSFEGKVQEGSGLPIHLAVTRQNVEVVKLLIEKKAALNSKVTRDGKEHYDVLHAAVFSEGRGGPSDLIKCLLAAKADHTRNLAGQYPLHLAFQCGSARVIPMLTEDMKARGFPPDAIEQADRNGMTPLQVAIKNGKFTPQELSKVAPLSPGSMKVFMHEYPQSVPSFLERISAECSREDDDMKDGMCSLAGCVAMEDVCKCLRRNPRAADVILNALMIEPRVDSEAWHPLPKRMSFGPRNAVERVRAMFNPERQFYCTYKPASWRTPRWEYDSTEFIVPKWHEEVMHDAGRPHHDVQFQVCQLPEVVCAELLGALQEADLDIFRNTLVRGVLDCIWWHGAYRVDLLQFFITLSGLLLLIVERAVYEYYSYWVILGSGGYDEEGDLERRLMGGRLSRPGGGSNSTGGDADDPVFTAFTPKIAHGFIGVRGFADFVNEVVQLSGLVAVGRGREYWSVGNMMDLLRAGLGMYFYMRDQRTDVQVVLILMYWCRLLEVSFSESLLRELLPITELAKGLAPSCVVCLIAVCAFAHAKWAMLSKPLWPNTFHDNFALLITSELPDSESPTMVLLFAYLAVSVFSVFFLNIFISVISENYSTEKANVEVTVQSRRCRACHTFLIRARALPCRLMSHSAVHASFWVAGALPVGVVAYHFWAHPASFPKECAVALALAQVLAFLAAYQDPAHAWSPQPATGADAEPRYMWIATIKEPEEQNPAYGMPEMCRDIQALKAMLMDMRDPDTAAMDLKGACGQAAVTGPRWG